VTPRPAASTSSAPTTQPVVARRSATGRLVIGTGRWHTVRSGDTLWGLASALLPSGASTAQIARQVAQLVALNADRIDSPDLIRVGQRLRLR
jgi:nucleoid-associated protein YgaU